DAAPGRPIGHRILGGNDVSAAELDRVDVKTTRQLVEDLLEGERGLRRTGRAIGARADPVRLDAERDDLVGCPAVRTDGQDRGDALDAALGEGAGLEAEARTQPGEAPVACRAGGQLEDA